jgi:hypothetical protein
VSIVGDEILLHCNSCRGPRNHTIRGIWAREPIIEGFPEEQGEGVQASVDEFISSRWGNQFPDSDWDWLYERDQEHLDQEAEAIIESLETWLNDDLTLQQQVWHEDATIWTLRRQGWHWIEILPATRYGMSLNEYWEIVDCSGCNTPSFRLRSWSEFDDYRDFDTGEFPLHKENVTRFPVTETYMPHQWMPRLPYEERRLMQWVYDAVNSRSLTLAAIGLRMVIERVIVTRVGERENEGLKGKLGRFVVEGFAGTRETEVLYAVIDAGSAAAHRGYAPSGVDMDTMIRVVESLLQRLYVFEYEASQLKSRTPQREA